MTYLGRHAHTGKIVRYALLGAGFLTLVSGTAVATQMVLRPAGDVQVAEQPAASPTANPGESSAPVSSPAATSAPPSKATRPPTAAPPSKKPRTTGWPGADNTGVPAGVTLSRYTGPSTITRDGTVIDGKSVTTCLNIQAKGVVIKRSKLTCDGDTIVRVAPNGDERASVTIEDSDIDGGRTAMAIGWSNYTLRRVDIYNINEGPRIGNKVLIEDSWIHGMVLTNKDDHQDALQTTGGVGSIIRHNTIDAMSPTDHTFNAAFMVGAEFGPLRGLRFEDNLVNGGGFSINVRNDPQMSDNIFRRNTFQRGGIYGAVVLWGINSNTTQWDKTNVWKDNGKPVAVSRQN